jgi:NADH dehydrogenase
MGRCAIRELRGRSVDLASVPGWSPARGGSRCSPRGPVGHPDGGLDGRRRTRAAARRDRAALTERGLLRVEATLRVTGVNGAWAAGDAASSPTPPPCNPAPTARPTPGTPSAGPVSWPATSWLNCGRPLTAYRHTSAGSVSSLAPRRGVAHVYGHEVKGSPAWFLHRACHLSRVHRQPQGAHPRRMDAFRALQARNRLHPARWNTRAPSSNWLSNRLENRTRPDSLRPAADPVPVVSATPPAPL